MKKVLYISIIFLVSFSIFAIIYLDTPSTILYLLNWGEYIDKDLVSKFEREYNCQVVEENVTSSEAMYQKITSMTTSYDIAIPGDYVVSKLYNEGYLREIDVNNSSYEVLCDYENIFSNELSSLMQKYMLSDDGNEFNSYYMPYFWGSYSIIYSNNNEEVESVIKENNFNAIWDRSLYKSNVKIGMYDNARWILSSYLLSKNIDPNITSYDGTVSNDLSNEIRDDCISALKSVKFDEFGNDSLKRNVINTSLDLCFTQSGDFFDALYLYYSTSNNTSANFNIYVPKTTAAFFDSMVIPTTCQNYTLANSFINFMLREENAYQNALTIGYSPALKTVVNAFKENSKNGAYYYEDENKKILLSDFLNLYPYYLNPLYETENVYILKPKSIEYLTTCEAIFNSLA